MMMCDATLYVESTPSNHNQFCTRWKVERRKNGGRTKAIPNTPTNCATADIRGVGDTTGVLETREEVVLKWSGARSKEGECKGECGMVRVLYASIRV